MANKRLPKTWFNALIAACICPAAIVSWEAAATFAQPNIGNCMGPDTGSTAYPIHSALASEPQPDRQYLSEFPDAYWRSLQLFNGYRLAVAILLLAAGGVLGDNKFLGAYDRATYLYTSVAYV